MKRFKYILVSLIILFFSTNGFCEFFYPSWETAQKKLFGNTRLMEKKLMEYIEIADNNRNKYIPQWKVSELTYYLWENYMFNKEYNKCYQVIKIGYNYGKRALKINPNGKEALFWFSANIGIYGLLKGPANVLQLVPKEIKLLERLKKADPNMTFERGSWGRILGKIYAFIPPFPVSVGNIDKGISLLKETVMKYPDYGINRNFSAEAYLVKGEIKKAKQLLENNVIMLQNSDLGIFANRRDLRIAKNLLKITDEYIKKGENHISYMVLSKIEYH